MRGDCSFCWYWWNCWPSLLQLFYALTKTTYYHKNMDNTIAGSMNDNINMDNTIAGSINDNISMWSLLVHSNVQSMQGFYRLFITIWDPRREDRDHSNRFSTARFFVPGFPTSYVVVFFVFSKFLFFEKRMFFHYLSDL
jgi:hypothetical protein